MLSAFCALTSPVQSGSAGAIRWRKHHGAGATRSDVDLCRGQLRAPQCRLLSAGSSSAEHRLRWSAYAERQHCRPGRIAQLQKLAVS